MKAQGLAAMFAEHVTRVGPISGAWFCPCGAVSKNGQIGSGDLTTRDERTAEFCAHLASVALAWLETVAGDAAVREVVAEAIGDAWLDDGHGLACQYRDNPHDVTAATSADAAVAALTRDRSARPHRGSPTTTTPSSPTSSTSATGRRSPRSCTP